VASAVTDYSNGHEFIQNTYLMVRTISISPVRNLRRTSVKHNKTIERMIMKVKITDLVLLKIIFF